MLVSASKVTVEIYDIAGRLISTPIQDTFSAGTNQIVLNRNSSNLSRGYYIYKVSITNENGTFTENKKMLVQ